MLLIKTDNNFQSQWQKTYGCRIINMGAGFGANIFIKTANNGYLMVATTQNAGNCVGAPFPNGQSVFIKTDSLGNKLFEKVYGTNYGGGAVDVIRNIIETKDGGIIVGSTGHADMYNFCNTAGVKTTDFWNVYKLDNTLGIEQNFDKKEDLKIYPNPANDVLNIEGLNEKADAYVYDLSGKLVLKNMIANGQVDISRLAGGLYFIKVLSGEGSVVRKFVKD
jgi:hypothetical protein